MEGQAEGLGQRIRQGNSKSKGSVGQRLTLPPFAKCAKDGAPGPLWLVKREQATTELAVAWDICTLDLDQGWFGDEDVVGTAAFERAVRHLADRCWREVGVFEVL